MRRFVLLLALLAVACPAPAYAQDSSAYPGPPYPERGGFIEQAGELLASASARFFDMMHFWQEDPAYDWQNVLIPTDIRESVGDSDATGCASDQACEADRDGDGDTDYVLCGDFNGDGSLTMDGGCTDPGEDGCDSDGDRGDVLACLDALTDTDGGPDGYRVLEILPGRYTVPAEPWTAHNSGVIADNGILEPGPNTVIRCRPGAILMGSGLAHDDTPDQISIIYIDVANVHIDGCELDGAYPDETLPIEDRVVDCSSVNCEVGGASRMGVIMRSGAQNVSIQNTWSHHHVHSCFYGSGLDNLTFKNNRASWCGSAWDSSGTRAPWPGLYIFSTGGDPATGNTIERFSCTKNAGACVNTRAESTNADNRIVNLTVRHLRVTDDGTGDAAGRVPKLIAARGIHGLTVEDAYGEGVGRLDILGSDYPVSLQPGPYANDADGAVCLDGSNVGSACDMDADCPGATTCDDGASGCCAFDADGAGSNIQNSNVTLRRIDLRDGAGLSLGSYVDGITVEDVSIQDTSVAEACITATGPYRNLVLDTVQARNCGQNGIFMGNGTEQATWGNPNANEAITLRRIAVDGVDGDMTDTLRWRAFSLLAGCVGCTFEDMNLHGTAEDGFLAGAGTWANNIFRRMTIDYLPDPETDPNFGGIVSVGDLPTCTSGLDGLWYWVDDAASGSDCSTGASTRLNACVCNDDGTADWDDTDAVGSTTGTDSFCMDFTDLGASMDDNTFSDIWCRSGGRNQRHMIELPDNAGSTGNTFERILCTDTRRGALNGEQAAGCIDFHASTGTWENVECELLFNNGSANRRCVCEDASCSTGSAY